MPYTVAIVARRVTWEDSQSESRISHIWSNSTNQSAEKILWPTVSCQSKFKLLVTSRTPDVIDVIPTWPFLWELEKVQINRKWRHHRKWERQRVIPVQLRLFPLKKTSFTQGNVCPTLVAWRPSIRSPWWWYQRTFIYIPARKRSRTLLSASCWSFRFSNRSW